MDNRGAVINRFFKLKECQKKWHFQEIFAIFPSFLQWSLIFCVLKWNLGISTSISAHQLKVKVIASGDFVIRNFFHRDSCKSKVTAQYSLKNIFLRKCQWNKFELVARPGCWRTCPWCQGHRKQSRFPRVQCLCNRCWRTETWLGQAI